ncbi:MAG TPA: hypothetical protein VLJ61_02795 [Pyrinomonadaceae bacterium]|nr:hypothetical protein [Pyrinomonadaceae bacterium]
MPFEEGGEDSHRHMFTFVRHDGRTCLDRTCAASNHGKRQQPQQRQQPEQQS